MVKRIIAVWLALFCVFSNINSFVFAEEETGQPETGTEAIQKDEESQEQERSEKSDEEIEDVQSVNDEKDIQEQVDKTESEESLTEENDNEQASSVLPEESSESEEEITEADYSDLHEREPEQEETIEETKEENEEVFSAGNTFNDFEYTIVTLSGNPYATITKYTGSDSVVVIPSNINGATVTKIGSKAFSGCSSITNITIPETITAIGDNAFYDCRRLKSITVPGSVTNIDRYTFKDCVSLTSVILSEGVLTVSDYAFEGCMNIEYFRIPSTLNKISTGIPSEKLKTLGAVGSGSNVEVSGQTFKFDVFNNYYKPKYSGQAYYSPKFPYIEKLVVSDNFNTIENNTFFEYIHLTDVYISDNNSNITIGQEAFSGCSKLVNVHIGDGVEKLEDGVFSGCTSLTKINVGRNVSYIDWNVFDGCTQLKTVIFPLSLMHIKEWAFRSAPVETVYYEGTEADREIIDFTGESASIKYNAEWIYNYEPYYTISYNANGGTGAPKSQQKPNGEDIVLSSNIPTFATVSETWNVLFDANGGQSTGADGNTIEVNCKTEYEFACWTDPSDNKTYEPGSVFTKDAKTELLATYTAEVTTDTISLPEPIAATGYDFVGWYLGDVKIGEAGDNYQPGENNIILEAKWQKHILTKVNYSEATCDRTGNNQYWFCETCGKYYSDINGTQEIEKDSWIIPALGHQLTKVNAVPATCETAGSSAYWICERCGNYYSDKNGQNEIEEDSWIISALGHDWSDWETVTEATCTEAGEEERVCRHDSNHKETRTVKALGHSLTKTDAVPATCTTAGSSAYWTCERCGNYYSDQYGRNEIEEDSWIIPASGHDWSDWKTVTPATCTAEGTERRTCGNDPSHYEERTIPSLGHDYGEWIITKPATCEEAGEKQQVCANDPTHINKTVIPALGHDWGTWIISKEPTCTEEGLQYRVCENDSEHVETKVLNTIPHSWSTWTVLKNPTYLEEGIMMRFCTSCGEEQIKTISVIAHEHSFTYTAEKPATCEEEGNTAYYHCRLCDRYYSDSEGKNLITLDQTVIPALGHDWGEWKTFAEATCESEGIERKTCQNDPSHYEERVIPALGHNYSSWITVKEATCEEEGEQQRVCKNDADHKETRVLEKLGHSLIKTEAKEPTTTEEGNTEYWTCERCGKYFSDEAGEHEIEKDSWIIPVLDKTDPESISFENDSAEMPTKDTLQLKVKASPENADDSVIWISSNTKIASVDKNGVVTAKTYGKTTITAISTVDTQLKAEMTIQTRFYDVNDSTQSYYKPVYWGADNGVVAGYDGGEYFGPDNVCTRAQFVTFLWRLAGRPTGNKNVSFKDISTSVNYYNAVKWAVSEGIIVGYKDDNTFRPDNEVTRGQVATMLWRFAGRKTPTLPSTSPFTDINSSNSSYRAVVWGQKAGVIKGYKDGSFQPDASCLRQHIVTFLYRYARDVMGRKVN